MIITCQYVSLDGRPCGTSFEIVGRRRRKYCPYCVKQVARDRSLLYYKEHRDGVLRPVRQPRPPKAPASDWPTRRAAIKASYPPIRGASAGHQRPKFRAHHGEKL